MAAEPTPTPSSSTPAVSATAGAAPQSSAADTGAPEQDWGSLLGDLDAPEPVAQQAEPTPPTPAPQPEPQPVEPAAEPQPTDPQAQPQQPQEPQQPQQPQGPTPEFRREMVQRLTPRYTFDEATTEAFHENPQLVLPQLAATLHMNILEDVAKMVDAHNEQFLPTAFEKFFGTRISSMQAQAAEQQEVYAPYPKLKEVPKDEQRAIAQAIARKHPKSSRAERIRLFAEAVYAVNGWEMPWKKAQGPVPEGRPAPTGYVPISPAAGGPPPAPTSDNPFENLLD